MLLLPSILVRRLIHDGIVMLDALALQNFLNEVRSIGVCGLTVGVCTSFLPFYMCERKRLLLVLFVVPLTN